jgi:hypothetical protein
MEYHYVLTGRFFQSPVDIRSAVEEQFETIEIPSEAVVSEHDASEYESESPDIAFVNSDWGGLIIFHCSWGGGLSNCEKVKGYVLTHETTFIDDREEIFEWEDRISKKMDQWLTENTDAEPLEQRRA